MLNKLFVVMTDPATFTLQSLSYYLVNIFSKTAHSPFFKTGLTTVADERSILEQLMERPTT